ncbi:MAG TPA: hypothetical protein VFX25_09625 [Streptosporangiaceae bacterium]|nr:hypothetical protein [Streptosporangiaceae bacterium]
MEIAQAESEATRGEPLPEEAPSERRGRSVVQSVRLPAEEFTEIGADRGADRGAGRGASRGLIQGWALAGLAAERGSSLRDAIEHLAEEAQRLRPLAATWPEFTVARTWTRWEVIHDTAWR